MSEKIEKKKRVHRVDKLAYAEGITRLIKVSKLAKNLERKNKTRVFALGAFMVATNGEIVYDIAWMRDKKLLDAYLENCDQRVMEGKNIWRPEIASMIEGIQKTLKEMEAKK